MEQYNIDLEEEGMLGDLKENGQMKGEDRNRP
jgi:hypothetical protein